MKYLCLICAERVMEHLSSTRRYRHSAASLSR
jgi:hypothetical protein